VVGGGFARLQGGDWLSLMESAARPPACQEVLAEISERHASHGACGLRLPILNAGLFHVKQSIVQFFAPGGRLG